jgi:hypothetical protein
VALLPTPQGEVMGEIGVAAAHLDPVAGRPPGQRQLQEHGPAVDPEVAELDGGHFVAHGR